MNKNILNTGVQSFIDKNLNTDILSILLKKSIFEGVSQKEIATQIEAKKKSEIKLPTWFQTKKIYYPNKLNIAQSSSEITAKYKAEIVAENSLIDISGGFGVDSFFFSKRVKKITHCEINKTLSSIVKHNFEQLQISNIKCLATDGILFLKENTKHYNWIYIDPSRRDKNQQKVFFLNDCLPNVPENLETLFSKSNNILLKTSPLLDLQIGIKELKHVKEIHSIAVNNDVKELLWVLEKDFNGNIAIKTSNIKKDITEAFNFLLPEEKDASATYSEVKKYIYEPNAAILKTGAFKTLSKQLNIAKLHVNSHLYTSDSLVDFPGRTFSVLKTLPYTKKTLLKNLPEKKANITTRNFPETVAQIRKKTGIKEGGNKYLFFTTTKDDKHIVLFCEKK